MKKQVNLAARIVKKSMFAYILLMTFTLIAVYHVIILRGMDEYTYYGFDEVKKYLLNSDYTDLQSGGYEIQNGVSRLNQLRNIDGIKGVLHRIEIYGYMSVEPGGKRDVKKCRIVMYSEEYGKYYRDKLFRGSYSDFRADDAGAGCITNIAGVDIGEKLYIFSDDPRENAEMASIKINIAGKLYPNGKVLEFGAGGTMDVTRIYVYANDIIIMPYSEKLMELMKPQSYSVDSNCIVMYDDGISAAKKESIREDVVGKNADYVSMDGMLGESEKKRKETGHGSLFLPLMMIYLSAVTFMVVSVISAYKYMKEFSVYYIVGSTKREIIRETMKKSL